MFAKPSVHRGGSAVPPTSRTKPRERRRQVGTRDHVAIEIAVGDVRAAIEAVIVVELLPEVEGALGQRVVVDAVAQARIAASAEEHRPVLVQRIARFAVVAQRVELQRAQPAAVLVERPGLVAHAEVLVLRIARHGVHDALRPLPDRVRVGRTIGAAGDPVAADALLPRDAERREADDGAQARRRSA